MKPGHRNMKANEAEVLGLFNDLKEVRDQCAHPRGGEQELVPKARLSGTSGMTASTRKSLGLIREDADMRALLFKLMHETTAVGRAAGVGWPEDFATELERR